MPSRLLFVILFGLSRLAVVVVLFVAFGFFNIVVFELSLQDADDLVDGFFFQVGAAEEIFFAHGKNVAGGVAADVDEHVDNPLVDFIGEFAEVDIVGIFVALAVNVDVLDCDYYRFQELDAGAVNAYQNEYMSQYYWADFLYDGYDDYD